jgi:SOS-response transcriptional repressor LexA
MARPKNYERMEAILKYLTEYMTENQTQPSVAQIAEHFRLSTSIVHRYLKDLAQERKLGYENGVITLKVGSRIQYNSTKCLALDNIGSCGPGTVEEQHVVAFNMLSPFYFPEKNLVSITASGDSMTDAGIAPGDTLFIEIDAEPKEGDIVAALDDEGETQIKRLKGFRKNGQPKLAYENEALYPGKLVKKNIVRIQGVVRHILKDC